MVSSGSDDRAARRPLIGLTTYTEQARMLAWDTDFAMLQRTYVDAVARAGGTPVLLPPVEHGADGVLDALAGLVLTGGADVDPARYGEAQHPETTGLRPDRDAWELDLLTRALDLDLPVLGVCRGTQVLNVGLGGSLTQHLPDVVGNQDHRPQVGVFGGVRVRLAAGSRLAGLLGDELPVSCHHHQSIDRLAAGLTAVGWAPDGTVEAVELPGRRFTLGVQWHPEEDRDVRLFAALVAATRSTGTEDG